jgi:CubicO group peptidase (beta-lactamase class C family)
VEDVTGQDYARFMKEQVLKPLGMTSSSYEQPYTHIDSVLLATGYDQQGIAIPGKYHIYPEQAAAGLWTNPTELARYVIMGAPMRVSGANIQGVSRVGTG